MIVKVTELYSMPEDFEAFVKHYKEVHIPLVEKLPHLTHFTIGKVVNSSPYFLMFEMYYPDVASRDAALQSEENSAVAKDLTSFAGDPLRLLIEVADD